MFVKQPKKTRPTELQDGQLAAYPAENDPHTHVTAAIQEMWGLNPHLSEATQWGKETEAPETSAEK
jgi:dienelactone hydrolase